METQEILDLAVDKSFAIGTVAAIAEMSKHLGKVPFGFRSGPFHFTYYETAEGRWQSCLFAADDDLSDSVRETTGQLLDPFVPQVVRTLGQTNWTWEGK